MNVDEMNKELIMACSDISTITMGCDPEFFVVDSKNKTMNADKFFPDKKEPMRVSSRTENQYSNVFFDGIQGEMSVMYNTCREYLSVNIKRCLRQIFKTIPEDHKVILRPSVKVAKEIIDSAHPEARIFGCAPDYNAYTLSVNTPEMNAEDHPYRYAGGHIHLGKYNRYAKGDHPEAKLVETADGHLRLIKMLDLIVSVPTFFLDTDPGSKRRKTKYGKAGCFRPTPYGVEYRTPSCWWLKSPATVSLVFGLARLAWTICVAEKEQELYKAIGFDENEIRGALDESDVKTVNKIWDNLIYYVALMGPSADHRNPINLTSLSTFSPHDHVPSSYSYIDLYRRKRYEPMLYKKPVFNLAILAYTIKNGIKSLVQSDVKTEWGLAGEERGDFDGFARLSKVYFRNNKDFFKFQDSFLSEKFPEVLKWYSV